MDVEKEKLKVLFINNNIPAENADNFAKIFAENGYTTENVDLFRDISTDDLCYMGIVENAHQVLIFRMINKVVGQTTQQIVQGISNDAEPSTVIAKIHSELSDVKQMLTNMKNAYKTRKEEAKGEKIPEIGSISENLKKINAEVGNVKNLLEDVKKKSEEADTELMQIRHTLSFMCLGKADRANPIPDKESSEPCSTASFSNSPESLGHSTEPSIQKRSHEKSTSIKSEDVDDKRQKTQ